MSNKWGASKLGVVIHRRPTRQLQTQTRWEGAGRQQKRIASSILPSQSLTPSPPLLRHVQNRRRPRRLIRRPCSHSPSAQVHASSRAGSQSNINQKGASPPPPFSTLTHPPNQAQCYRTPISTGTLRPSAPSSPASSKMSRSCSPSSPASRNTPPTA